MKKYICGLTRKVLNNGDVVTASFVGKKLFDYKDKFTDKDKTSFISNGNTYISYKNENDYNFINIFLNGVINEHGNFEIIDSKRNEFNINLLFNLIKESDAEILYKAINGDFDVNNTNSSYTTPMIESNLDNLDFKKKATIIFNYLEYNPIVVKNVKIDYNMYNTSSFKNNNYRILNSFLLNDGYNKILEDIENGVKKRLRVNEVDYATILKKFLMPINVSYIQDIELKIGNLVLNSNDINNEIAYFAINNVLKHIEINNDNIKYILLNIIFNEFIKMDLFDLEFDIEPKRKSKRH